MAIPRSKLARAFYRCADRRRVEARILFNADQPTGAVYLGGYVVEFMLKALILESSPAQQQDALLDELKRIGHDPTRLLEVVRQRGGTRPPAEVVRAFSLVASWSSEMRYDPSEIDADEAEGFLDAVAMISRWADGRM
jgi:hypothetical protein